jgi:hypothetical protein
MGMDRQEIRDESSRHGRHPNPHLILGSREHLCYEFDTFMTLSHRKRGACAAMVTASHVTSREASVPGGMSAPDVDQSSSSSTTTFNRRAFVYLERHHFRSTARHRAVSHGAAYIGCLECLHW